MQRKALFFFICLIAAALLCSCAASSTDSGESRTAGRAEAAGETSSLKNAKDWEIGGEISLDEVIDTNESDGITTIYTLFPSVWPEQEFDESVPEYMGAGWMYLLIASVEAENPENRMVVSLSIYGYSEDELEEYKIELTAAGFDKTPESKYSSDVKSAIASGSVDGYSRYSSKECAVQLIQNHDDNGDFLQITVMKYQ